MKKKEILILVVLAVIALTIFSAIGLILMVPNNQPAQAAAQPTPVAVQSTATPTPTPTPTRVKLELPTAVPEALEPTPVPTQVVVQNADQPAGGEDQTRPSLAQQMGQYIAEHKPQGPRPQPTSAPQTNPGLQPTPAPQPASEPLSPPPGVNLPTGKWEYFASDGWGDASEYIALEIKPEDASRGRISAVGAIYGNTWNPCEAYFIDVPVTLEEGELKFHQMNRMGSVVGAFKDGGLGEIAVLIQDNLCTGDVFGILSRAQ